MEGMASTAYVGWGWLAGLAGSSTFNMAALFTSSTWLGPVILFCLCALLFVMSSPRWRWETTSFLK